MLSAAAEFEHATRKKEKDLSYILFPKDGFESDKDLRYWVNNMPDSIVVDLLQTSIDYIEDENNDETDTEAETV